jgi:TRAP-type C4-dicarboxylate transport system permease small subunit
MGDLILQAHHWATRATKWMTVLAAVCIAFLMAVNFTDIIGTKFFLKSVPGALDITEELMVWLTLLPISYIALERGHIRITLLEDAMPNAMRFAFRILQYVIAILITGIVTSRAFVQFKKTFEVMQMKGGIELPIWPSNLIVVIAFGFLTIIWILLLAKTIVEGVK